jgi:hypothetical protein
VVRRLNEAGIPVVAWILLPEDQGYWPNAANVREVAARYDQIRAWSAENGLRWAAVALDVEPDQREIRRLIADWRSAMPTVLQRVFSPSSVVGAVKEYRDLVARFRADGYSVDSYVLPFVVDDRKVGSTLLQRVGGIVDVPADREVPMLYSSFVGSAGPGILWSYAPDFRSVAVGSTGGGVQIAGADKLFLDWEGFSRDLRLARRWTEDVHVFSLEGCVRQGFLERLLTLDWSAPVQPPTEMAAKVEGYRRCLRAVLWVDANPIALVAGLVAVVWLARRLVRRCC